jgi:DHA3 family macrolide efflux protein-like MFS transporter
MRVSKLSQFGTTILLFLTSQNISLFGSLLVQYAITWYITLTTQSGIMMTLAIICGFLPTFIISPFAGVWADRYNRKTLIILSDSLIALATFTLAVLFFLGYNDLWLLFVVLSIRSIGAGVHTPSVSAIIPQLVPQDKLIKINAANSSIQSLSMLIAPMISGMLLAIASIETVFFIDVVTAAIAVSILLIAVHVPTHAKALLKQTNGYFADLKLGLKYINNQAYLKALFVFAAIFFFLVAPAAFLAPLQVTRTFGSDVWRLTAVEVAFSSGMISGGILIAYWGGFRNKAHSIVASTLLMGGFTFALGLAPFFWLYLLFMALTGIALPIFNVPATTFLQQKIDPDFMGRVFGVLSMISSVMMPMGMIFFGPMADLVTIEWLMIGSGLLIFVMGLLMFTNKSLIEAGRPPVPEGNTAKTDV